MIKVALVWNSVVSEFESVDVKKFSGGEINITLPKGVISILSDGRHKRQAHIRAHINSSDDLMALLFTVDAMRRINQSTVIRVMIPYFPYARQDRVCNPGESLTLKVFADIINSMHLDEVIIVDPHSIVAPALINKVTVIDQKVILFNVLNDLWDRGEKDWVAFAPDAGAYKKVKSLYEHHSMAGFAHAHKKRDPLSMNISELEVIGDVTGKHVMVIDDICDGGRTFIELGNKLRELGVAKLVLVVTHGIFSRGTIVLDGIYDAVYSTNSIHPSPEDFTPEQDMKSDKLKWIDIHTTLKFRPTAE